MQRDPKGLYEKAKAGKIKNFTGIDAPYEAPPSPEVHLRTLDEKPEQMAERVIKALLEREIIGPAVAEHGGGPG